MTIKIFHNNPSKLKYNLSKLYGVSNKGDLLTLTGENEPLFLKICYIKDEGEGIRWFEDCWGTPLQELAGEITREYWRRRTHDKYIVRDDMVIQRM